MTPADQRAAVHDLGHRRYTGARRRQATRYLVIARHLFAGAMRGWWRSRIWLIGAAMTTVATGVVMYIFRNDVFRGLVSEGVALRFVDALVPMSLDWFTKLGFVVGTTVGAGLLAADLRAGAFEFYFARSVRPVDYLVGKLAGVMLLMAALVGAGPLLLALFRIGLSTGDSKALVAALTGVPRTLLSCAAAVAVYTAVPVGLGALGRTPRAAVAIWVCFYLLGGGAAEILAAALELPALAALDVQQAVVGVALGLYGASPVGNSGAVPPLPLALLAVALYTAIGTGLVIWRVARAYRAGLGGG